MKKLLCVLISLMLLVSLAACKSASPSETPETQTHTEKDEVTAPETGDGSDLAEGFLFAVSDVSLCPGAVFDPSALPEADSTFEIESCAGQGTDTVYSYENMEVTVFNDGTKSIIYSIYLLDPNSPTPEGLYLGDEKAQVETIYGTNYEVEDTELVFTFGDTQLRILLEEDIVTAIEYRLITE